MFRRSTKYSMKISQQKKVSRGSFIVCISLSAAYYGLGPQARHHFSLTTWIFRSTNSWVSPTDPCKWIKSCEYATKMWSLFQEKQCPPITTRNQFICQTQHRIVIRAAAAATTTPSPRSLPSPLPPPLTLQNAMRAGEHLRQVAAARPDTVD